MRRLCAILCLAACGKSNSPSSATGAGTCIDADGDGYGVGAKCTCLGGCSDCNDSDHTVYRLATVYTDADHDTYGVGSGTEQCIGAQPPVGLALRAGDCNDASAGCTTDCTDADGDGVPACAGDCDDTNPYCIETCVDADSDHHCGVKDCNDHAPLHWDDCTTCVDTDGDGRGPGCDVGTSDCDANDPNNWVSCATCKDADGDGYFAHCDAYRTIQGEDCDDTDAVCVFDCGDADHDGVRACDGDCNDGDTETACALNAIGASANLPTDDGGAGGQVRVTGSTVTFLGAVDALPAALFTHGAVPTAADALRVTSDQSLSTPTQAVGGLFVAKGATLTLHGAGPFEFDVSDHVFIAGSIVSDHDGVTLTIKPTASGLDATLVGTIDLHGSPSANGGAGGSLSVGTLAAKFSHAVIYGSVALRSGDAVSDPGVSGGTLQAYAGDIFMAADVDAHSGSGVQSGGTITLAADNSATVREGGIIASGGASSHVPGQGGTFTATAAGAFTSTASVLITLRGGTATSSGAGGSGGVCGLASDASGSASTSLSSPTIVASGGDSSSGAAGNGGSVTIATGNSAANADAITVVGGIDVTGAHGGTVLVAAYDQGSTIAINGPLLAHGVSAGGAVALTGTVLPAHGSAYALPLNASVTIDADVSADGGSGVVDFNVATLSYTAGAISALGTGGQCITRTGTAVGGTVGTNVLDGDGAGTYGDLGVVDTRP